MRHHFTYTADYTLGCFINILLFNNYCKIHMDIPVVL